MEEPVTIVDRDTLKVMSVDTRIDIMKELSQGERTPSDLGKRLRKSDATIIEHLNGLIKAGLVKKIEHPGKKWVFYTLTERGRGILSSKSRRLIIVVATSILALAGSFVSFLQYNPIFRYFQPAALVTSAQKGAESYQATQNNLFLYLSIVLFVMSLFGFGLCFYLMKNSKKYYKREEKI